LAGPVASADEEPSDQTPVEPEATAPLELYGVLSLPDGGQTPCATFVWRSETGDEVTFAIPIGSLGRSWPEIGGFPFGTTAIKAEAWEPRLEQHLFRLAGHLHARVPFLRAEPSHAWIVR
jgi:hypothetical protein